MKISLCNLKKIPLSNSIDSVLVVSKKLRDEKQKHCLILEGGQPVGIISVTDINNRLVAEDKDATVTKAKEIMTKDILIKNIDDSLSGAYIDMIKTNKYSCIILKGGKVEGILDLKEAMNCIVKLKHDENKKGKSRKKK